MGKLAWYLFGEEEPAAESEKREPAAPPDYRQLLADFPGGVATGRAR